MGGGGGVFVSSVGVATLLSTYNKQVRMPISVLVAILTLQLVISISMSIEHPHNESSYKAGVPQGWCSLLEADKS